MAEYDDFGTQVNPEFLGGQTINPVADYLARFWRRITPTQRTPGGLLAPSFPNTPITPADLADPTAGIGNLPQGALATVGQPRVRPKKKGVFADYQPSFGGAQESDVAMPLAAEPDVARAEPAAPVAAPATPAATQKGLREQYMERLAAMAKQPESSKMTEQQKGMALLEASLAGMAAASKPGASLMGSIGQGGQVGMAAARDIEKVNREQAERRRAEDRANVSTEFALAGHDIDRADRKEDKAETRRIREEDLADRSADRKATDKRENRRIDLLKQQLDAGKVQVVKNDESGTLVILNTTTNEKKDTGIKFKREDGRPAEVQLLDSLMSSPSRMAAYKEIKGEKGGITNKDIFNKAFEATVAQVKDGNQTPIDQLLQTNTDLAKRAAGFTTGTGTIGGSSAVISRADPKYQEALRDPRIGGNQAKLDEQLKKAGKRVVD